LAAGAATNAADNAMASINNNCRNGLALTVIPISEDKTDNYRILVANTTPVKV